MSSTRQSSTSGAVETEAALRRAEQAEHQVEELKQTVRSLVAQQPRAQDDQAADESAPVKSAEGLDSLRSDPMMAHLLQSLESGEDIGHYGRLVFAMVARHFLSASEVLEWLQRDRDFGEAEAQLMLRQVEARGYNPPRRERILEWQREQSFPIIPNEDDPDCGNVYRSLKFPEDVYEHIQEYQEEKVRSEG